MFKFDKSMYGKKVRFINAEAHEEEPDYYPEVGTIGTLVPVKGTDFEYLVDNLDDFAVQWPKGTTTGHGGDLWLVDEKSLELVEEV